MSDNRAHLEEKYTWDLTTIFATDADWETEYESTVQDLKKASAYAGHLLDSAKNLLEATELYMSLMRRLEKIYVYASMKNDQDTTVGLYQEYQAKASNLYSQLSEAFAYFEPEFMALDDKKLAEFKEQEPGLGLYDHYFERLLANKDHVLSQEAEELLAAAGDIFNGPTDTFNVLDNADILFPWVSDGQGDVVELTHGNFITLMESKDRDIRKGAYEAMYGTYEQFQHTYAQTLQGVVKVHNYQAKASNLYSQLSGAFAYFEPEFMALDAEKLASFKEQEPGLGLYDHYFERLLANKDHVLSQEAEELLAAAGDIFNGPTDTFNVLDNADILFPWVSDGQGDVVELTHGNFITLMESKDRDIRKGAYEAMYGTYEQFQHTYAQTLQGVVKVHNYQAKVRHYNSARHAALAANFIPESVYDSLLESVNKHLPLLHRYLDLRKKVLGLDELKMYDVYTPLSETETALTYEESLRKAEEVLAIFGEEYSKGVHAAFTERWIDVHPNKGKRSGAYSGGAYDTNAFMLLNWQDTLDNLFTLVHETGHSLHSTFTRQTQPYVYGDYPIFLAEIASTTNENILTETLLKEVKDDKTRFAILNHYLDGFKGTVFRQTQFAEFEHAIHEADASGQILTADFMNKLYADLNEKYYNLKAEDNYEIQFEWERIPHFYMNYYVYQYATGFAAASYLAEKIVHGTEEDKEAYLTYLKAGSSDYPLEVIKKAGVDMTNTDYLDAAFKVFEDRLVELEALVEKGVHLS